MSSLKRRLIQLGSTETDAATSDLAPRHIARNVHSAAEQPVRGGAGKADRHTYLTLVEGWKSGRANTFTSWTVDNTWTLLGEHGGEGPSAPSFGLDDELVVMVG